MVTILGVEGAEYVFEDQVLGKHGWLCNGWRGLYAGDLTRVTPIIVRLRRALQQRQDARHRWEMDAVEMALNQAFKTYRYECLENSFLSRFRMTYEDYLLRYESIFSEHDRHVINRYIRRATIGVRMIVCGFDRYPHLMMVDDPGGVRTYDTMGYCAIGSGANIAFQRMMQTRPSGRLSLAETVLWALEAKFRSEAEKSVGYATIAYIHSIDTDDELYLHRPDVDSFHDLWRANPDGFDRKTALQMVTAAISAGRRRRELLESETPL